jgi:hypothetical protein
MRSHQLLCTVVCENCIERSPTICTRYILTYTLYAWFQVDAATTVSRRKSSTKANSSSTAAAADSNQQQEQRQRKLPVFATITGTGQTATIRRLAHMGLL